MMWTLKECLLNPVIFTAFVSIVGPLFEVPNMTAKAELTRQEYLTPRRIMLERLQQFIRKPDKTEEPVKYFEPSGPLSEYLHS